MSNRIDIEKIQRLTNGDFTNPETQGEILKLIETLCGVIIMQQKEIQELKDEINRLKGEKGKPKFKDKKPAVEKDKNDADKMESGEKSKWKKGTKRDKVKIDRTETVKMDTTGLPNDVEFKGYEERVIQNIIVQTDNVLYRLEKYYSPSQGKTYTAELPESLRGTEFGPETKALIFALYYENRVTENKIASFLNANGLHISEGTISNILIKEQAEELTKIKNDILEAGIKSSPYQQIDDTGMKVGGKSGYATIVCNNKFSAFFIRMSKSRETVKGFLTAYLVSLFIVLLGDDAPQFKEIASKYALCWVHEERHYKKLVPILNIHKEELKRVRGEIWAYYKKLKNYKENPTERAKDELSKEFDVIFGQKVNYEELNNRLSLTLNKKQYLLVVLEHPEVPLHNNLSENGIREIVIKRKISGGVETEDGVKAWENNMSILATCKKLNVSFYDFIKGVFTKNNSINLADLIAHQ